MDEARWRKLGNGCFFTQAWGSSLPEKDRRGWAIVDPDSPKSPMPNTSQVAAPLTMKISLLNQCQGTQYAKRRSRSSLTTVNLEEKSVIIRDSPVRLLMIQINLTQCFISYGHFTYGS